MLIFIQIYASKVKVGIGLFVNVSIHLPLVVGNVRQNPLKPFTMCAINKIQQHCWDTLAMLRKGLRITNCTFRVKLGLPYILRFPLPWSNIEGSSSNELVLQDMGVREALSRCSNT